MSNDKDDNVTKLEPKTRSITIVDGMDGSPTKGDRAVIKLTEEQWLRQRAAMHHCRVTKQAQRPNRMPLERVIWKVELRFERKAYDLPWNAQFLKFDMQAGRPVAWFMIDKKFIEKPKPRYFVIVGTGHDIGAVPVYLGTVQDQGFVWHLLETDKPRAGE